MYLCVMHKYLANKRKSKNNSNNNNLRHITKKVKRVAIIIKRKANTTVLKTITQAYSNICTQIKMMMMIVVIKNTHCVHILCIHYRQQQQQQQQ